MSDLADKIKEALKAGRSGQGTRTTLLERFGFKSDPFQLKFDPEADKPFIPREDVLIDFAKQLGYVIGLFEDDPSTPFRHLLMHGVHGIGKTTLALHFVEERETYGLQDFSTIYANLSNWRDPDTVREEFSVSNRTLQTYQRFLEDLKATDNPVIIFVDDFDYTITGTAAIPRMRRFLADIDSHAPNGFIIVGLVSSLTLTVLAEPDYINTARTFYANFNPDIFFFPVFSKSEIRRLLTYRLRDVRRSTNIFSVKSLDTIANYSMGIPTTALRIASACLNELIVQNLDQVTSSVVQDIVEQAGFQQGVSLLESTEHETDDETVNILTHKRREIIASLLEHQTREKYFYPPTKIEGLRISDLAQLFGVNLSTMNYHIKPLTHTTPIPILETITISDGRSKLFRIDKNSPLATALELITIYFKLQPERYHVDSESIQITQREDQS